ncbi:MAG: MBL fold metallo-hydrolase [Eubacteriales bacterium]|nr:MBL fold metallo-hydrolase [Eubacteriales bacterium]
MLRFKQKLVNVPEIKVLESPFGDSWSGITLVSGEDVTPGGTKRISVLIDSGADKKVIDETLIPALAGEGLALDRIDWLLNTHTHGDHIGGHYRIRELAPSIKIATFRASLDKMKNPLKYNKLIRARFPMHSSPPSVSLRGVDPDMLLDDGDIMCGFLKLVHTPGHDDDTVSWLDLRSQTLITGDTLQGNGTPVQGISFYMYLDMYKATLKRLMDMKINNILTGHKYVPIDTAIEGADKVKECLEICSEITARNSSLVNAAMADGERDTAIVTRRVLAALGAKEPEFLFLAMYTIAAHIKETGG